MTNFKELSRRTFQFFTLAALCAFSSLTAPAQEATAQATPPPPAPPRSVTVPKPVERTLPNGLRVVVIERSNMPLVSASFVVKNGGEVDPAKLSGLADM
ncbi:MAG TPA: hypothetical protein VER76_01530, partial [Pyrinomonadaceae bacterium]|nr:hypothetical protein [Pyrinomonadaceae bacterium]